MTDGGTGTTGNRSAAALLAAIVVASLAVPAFGAAAAAKQQQAGGTLVVAALDAPAAAAPNSTIEVVATIRNPSAQEVTESVAFRFDGEGQDVVVRRQVTVAANASRPVTFRFDTTGVGTGDYILGVTTQNSSEFATIEVTDEALVEFEEQVTNGTTVTVESVFLPQGGYVAIHDTRLLEGDALASTIGVSAYLEPGYHEQVNVTLFDVPGAEFNRSRLQQGQILIAMPHRETSNDTTFSFVATNGSQDPPYVADGEVVTDTAPVVLAGNETTGNGTDGTGTGGDGSTGNGTDGSGTDGAGTSGDGSADLRAPRAT